MPSYAPRQETRKKNEELDKREVELILAIKKNIAVDKLIRSVEKYRKAQLSLLKAKIHQCKENEFQKKPNNASLEKLEEQIVEWTNKTNDEIIAGIKKYILLQK